MACRSGQLLLHWSHNKLPAGALHSHGTAPLQLAADSQGSPMKCEGEDGLWQHTAGFICSLGWELSCLGGVIDGQLGDPHPYSLAAAVSQEGEEGQEAEICGLNNSPRARSVSPAVFFPGCLWSLADKCGADDTSAALGPLAASCAADICGAHATGTAPLCCPPSLLELPGPLGAQDSLGW